MLIDIYVDMLVDTFIDICLEMFIDMLIGICVDMLIDILRREGRGVKEGLDVFFKSNNPTSTGGEQYKSEFEFPKLSYKFNVSSETNSKNSFSRSSCIRSDPRILTNQSKLIIKR